MLFCKESWYGSGLLNIFHLNKKVTKPPLHPLPLNNPVLHLSLFAGYWGWIFSTSIAALQSPALLQLSTLPNAPKSIVCPSLHRRAHCFVLSSSLPEALLWLHRTLALAHTWCSVLTLCAHTTLTLPFPPLRILGPTMGTTGRPIIQHYLYEGVSVRYY